MREFNVIRIDYIFRGNFTTNIRRLESLKEERLVFFQGNKLDRICSRYSYYLYKDMMNSKRSKK